MTTYPAVVTISDLTAATLPLSSAMIFETVQTTNGVGLSVQVPLSAIMTTVFGGLPTGGGTGNFLMKSSGTNYEAAWTAVPLGSGSSVSGILNVVNGGIGTAALSAHGVIVGNGTAALTSVVPTTTGYPLLSNGTASDPSFGLLNMTAVTGVLGVPNGGSGTSTLTAFGVLFGNGTSTVGITTPGIATGFPLLAQGPNTAPTFAHLDLTGISSQKGLSVIGVPGTTGTADLTTILASGANMILISNVGGTGLLFTTFVGTTGWPLVANGTLTFPSFAVLGVPGGGTGGTTFTNNGVIVGSGTAAFTAAAPSTAGNILIDQGTSAIPAFKVMSGDVTISSAGTATIGTAVVSYAKIQNVSATTLLGRKDATAGPPQEITTAILASAFGVMLTTANQTVLGGFAFTAFNNGTSTGRTITPNPFSSNYQYISNNGAWTASTPGTDCAIDWLVINTTGAGSITFAGYTVNTTNIGDALTTTSGSMFILSIRRIAGTSTYTVKALQ